MAVIKSRAPLRIGIAGGGTDIASYSDLYVGNVINATIDKYVYATIEQNINKSEIVFEATDLFTKEVYSIQDEIKLLGSLVILKCVYLYFIKTYNNSLNIPLRICTFCDSAIGSGLGTSSTLFVALIKSFSIFFKIELDNYQTAELAYKLEREDCNFNGGRQDQYSAVFGGLNFFEFRKQGVKVTPLAIDKKIELQLESSLILYYTGISRESEKIINQQSLNIEIKRSQSLLAMHRIKSEALLIQDALLTGNLKKFISSFKRGWDAKKESATLVSNPKINHIYQTAIECGAEAGKISGAGGGGYMLIYVNLENRAKVISGLEKIGGVFFNCHFVSDGVTSWIE